MIIWINGSINSGKTTIAKLLGETLEKTAVIEVDELRKFIAHTELQEAIPINLENTLLIAKNFIHHGYTVIIPYPLSENNKKYVEDSLYDSKVELKIFSLSPRLEIALLDRGARKLNDWERDRIKYHYEIGIPELSNSIKIDNSDQKPEETVLEIMTYL